MRMLIVGDIHLQRDKRHRGEKLLGELASLIEQEEIEHVMFLGDVFHYHEKAYAQCFKMYDSFLKRIMWKSVSIYHVVGNHEMSNSVEFLPEEHVLLPYTMTENIHVFDKPETVEMMGCKFSVIPYVPNGLFNIALNTLPKPSRLVFAHQEFSGADYGKGYIGKSTDSIPDGYKVISGHVHKANKSDKLWYVGTPMHSDFGDEGDKFVHIINLKNEDYCVEKAIKLSVPKYITHHVNCLELLEKGFSKDLDDGNDHRIIIAGTKPQCLAFRTTDLYTELASKSKVMFDPERESTVMEAMREVSSYQKLLEDYATEKGLGDTYASVFN